MPFPFLVLAAAEAGAWIYVMCVGGGAVVGAGATVGVIYALDNKKEKEKAKNDSPPPQVPSPEDLKSKLEETKVIESKKEAILSSSRQSIFTAKENEGMAQEKVRKASEVLEKSAEDMEEKFPAVEKNTAKLVDLINGQREVLEKHGPVKSHHPTQDLAQENIKLKEKVKRLTEENQRLTAEKKQLKDGNEMKDAMLMSLSEHIKRTTASSSHQPGSR